MKVLYKGHRYELNHLDGDKKSILQFVQRKPLHSPQEGVTNQEVIRALIDRVIELDKEVPWALNEQILHHLRMALTLHEARALIRHTEHGRIYPELVDLDRDGHFHITQKATEKLGQ